MRRFPFLFLTAIILSVVLGSCGDSDDLNNEDAFKKSKQAWQGFKDKTNNSYRYVVVESTWVGYSWETSITVKNGKIVERAFKAFEGDEESEVWVENENMINTKEDTPAYPAMTLDEVYRLAETDWLQKRNGITTFFEVKNDGMISICGYTENGCQDDCFIGIRISNIETLN